MEVNAKLVDLVPRTKHSITYLIYDMRKLAIYVPNCKQLGTVEISHRK